MRRTIYHGGPLDKVGYLIRWSTADILLSLSVTESKKFTFVSFFPVVYILHRIGWSTCN